jgi:hypothetical protein
MFLASCNMFGAPTTLTRSSCAPRPAGNITSICPCPPPADRRDGVGTEKGRSLLSPMPESPRGPGSGRSSVSTTHKREAFFGSTFKHPEMDSACSSEDSCTCRSHRWKRIIVTMPWTKQQAGETRPNTGAYRFTSVVNPVPVLTPSHPASALCWCWCRRV